MLKSLAIKNYALIEELDIVFNDGLTAITGETGAGKSILLGAFSLILGSRTDVGALFDASRKCVVEGCFDVSKYGIETFFGNNDLDYHDVLTLRREITPDGRSRAFVNDCPTTLAVMKQLGEFLVDIHSQQKTISLNNIDYQLELVDSFAILDDSVKTYGIEYSKYRSLIATLARLKSDEWEAAKERDYLQFIFDELEKAALRVGEKESLEAELRVQLNAEGIKMALQSSVNVIDEGEASLITGLQSLRRNAKELVKLYGDEMMSLSGRIDSVFIEIKDIASEFTALDDKIVFNHLRIEELSERLDLINRLEQKHHVTSDVELIALIEDIGSKLNSISSISDKIIDIEKEVSAQKIILEQLADDLTEGRLKAIKEIEKALIAIVVKLGMPDARFKIEHRRLEEFSLSGRDSVVFTFNANKGAELKEISKIASGGEMSRLMLAIKAIISSKKRLPTVVFDEIDTGVSGDIAAKMGEIMRQMSDNMQVVVITHLPQVASKAATHFYVYKDREKEKTTSVIIQLEDEQRVEEIAKMLSGENVTQAAIENAKQLMIERSRIG